MRPTDPDPDVQWVSPVTPSTDSEMAARHLHLQRLLHQMRRPLPLDDAARSGAPPLAVRGFVPGRDDDGWLQINNRAFAWHPDQRAWDRDRLVSLLAEPWVDLDGFLVHDDEDGTIDGFCWTREHPATGDDPAMGEIFVIAADPARHGTGLGRALTVAGLDHLAERGNATAMLYVEATNTAGIRLYERLGFMVHHSTAAYAADHGPTS